MDPVFLARIQFALTIGFHYIFPPLTIGMAWVFTLMQAQYLRTGDTFYKKMADFWIKIFSISFAIGVATGIVMEFQFGTNWATYSRFVGDIFGAPLAAEGILAFFLESTFLGVLLYGADRIGKKLYFISGLMVALGSTLSAFWIIVANSWQQTPAGYQLINGRAELVDFWAAVFNPSTLPRYTHTVSGALIAGSLFIAGISAYYFLKKQHERFTRVSLFFSLSIALFFSLMMGPLGHWHAVQVAQTQPVKLAAYEGLWETGPNAPLILFGLPNEETETTDYAISIPSALSILVGLSPSTVVSGLKEVPPELRPPLRLSFISFHTMVALGGFFILISGLALFLLYKNQLARFPIVSKILFYSLPLPVIANEFGWIAAEVGRQPWVVQGLLKTKEATSITVGAGEILFSIIMFSVIYLLLFCVWIFLLKRKIAEGPKL